MAPMRTRVVQALFLAAGLAGPAAAAEPTAFKGADLALGDQLIRQHKCSECHVRRVGGDGSAIYRPEGRIRTPAALRAMVEHCSTELTLQLFPEEIEAVSAALDRDHYRFR